MEKYDYRNAVRKDIDDYLKEHTECYIDENRRQRLEDDMFVSDSVTGNGSGSYTFSTWQAEENLCHNMDMLEEACGAFGDDMAERIKRGAENCDVTIRCYLVNQVLTEAVEEWNEIHPETEEDA